MIFADDLAVVHNLMISMAIALVGFSAAYFIMKGLRDESLGNDHFGDRLSDGNLRGQKHGE